MYFIARIIKHELHELIPLLTHNCTLKFLIPISHLRLKLTSILIKHNYITPVAVNYFVGVLIFFLTQTIPTQRKLAMT